MYIKSHATLLVPVETKQSQLNCNLRQFTASLDDSTFSATFGLRPYEHKSQQVHIGVVFSAGVISDAMTIHKRGESP